MRPLIILENIRSAYNVGNIIRTADALGYNVVISGFTPHPDSKEQVKKSSLGAEKSVNIVEFWNPIEAIHYIKKLGYKLIVGECCEGSIHLHELSEAYQIIDSIAILVGNEKTGVLASSIEVADLLVSIPMRGSKESLNVGQASAILMRHFQ